MSDAYEIFEYLEAAGKRSGEKSVRDAITLWKRSIKKAANPTARRKVPRAWVFEAHRLQSGICARCKQRVGRGAATGDHFIPLARGGADDASNIRMTCKRCNSAKGANPPEVEAKKTNTTILEQLRAARGEID